MKVDFKRTNTRQTRRRQPNVTVTGPFAINMSDRRSFNFSLVVSCKISSFANELNLFSFPKCLSGIEITLARSPMATKFCFGRAENLENYLFFARMASEVFDPNLYFKKVSCLLLVEVAFDFAVMSEEKRYVNRRSSFGIKRWRGVHDGEIKTKSSVCLLLHAHTWGRRSWHILHFKKQTCCLFILVTVFNRV